MTTEEELGTARPEDRVGDSTETAGNWVASCAAGFDARLTFGLGFGAGVVWAVDGCAGVDGAAWAGVDGVGGGGAFCASAATMEETE